MGTNFCHQCEATCCEKTNQEIERDKRPTIVKNTSIKFKRNQNKDLHKILIPSSPRYLNNLTNTSVSERTDISQVSVDNSQDGIIYILKTLTNSQIYENIIKGERLHNLLEPLTFYTNAILYDLLFSLLGKIIYSFKENFFDDEKGVIEVYKNYKKMYKELNDKNILDDIKTNIEEDSRLKYNLLDIIESNIEIFHFFKYKVLKGQEPYKIFYWEQYKDYINYIQQKIDEIRIGLININLSLGDNKLKIID
jgi:hypothetical protein